MIAKKPSRLSKLKMPAKKSPMGLHDLAALEHEENSESPEDEMNESPSHQNLEDALGIEKHPAEADENAPDQDSENESDDYEDQAPGESDQSGDEADEQEPQDHESSNEVKELDSISDDDLMAEIKKRGLLQQLEEDDKRKKSAHQGSDEDADQGDSQDMYS